MRNRRKITISDIDDDPINLQRDVQSHDSNGQQSRQRDEIMKPQQDAQNIVKTKLYHDYAFSDDLNHIYMEVADISEESESGIKYVQV